VLNFNLLANQTFVYILCNLFLYVIPQEVLPLVFVHLDASWMHQLVGVLSLLLDIFP